MSLLKSSQNLEKNMDKKQLINKCRYYKGEPDCPESIVKQGKEICWYYEMKWVPRSRSRIFEFRTIDNPF